MKIDHRVFRSRDTFIWQFRECTEYLAGSQVYHAGLGDATNFIIPPVRHVQLCRHASMEWEEMKAEFKRVYN